jgi:hypothetical protein
MFASIKTCMILGLVSIAFGFTVLVPNVGFILGIIALRREPARRGMVIAGLVLDELFVIGWALVVLLFLGIIGPPQPRRPSARSKARARHRSNGRLARPCERRGLELARRIAAPWLKAFRASAG